MTAQPTLRRRGLGAALVVGVLLMFSAGTSSASGGVAGGPSAANTTPTAYRWPVAGPVWVVQPFDAPADPYAAGHRGVDLSAAPGSLVLAAAEGVVRFAGSVTGRGVVVIAHPDGVLTEYEPVVASVAVGRSVHAGSVIGSVNGKHGQCPPGRCLHWGARRDGAYIDPTGLLQALGPVRLVPWDGRS